MLRVEHDSDFRKIGFGFILLILMDGFSGILDTGYFMGRKFRVFRDFCPFSRKFDPRKKCFRLLAKVNPTRNVLKCGFAKVKLEKKNPKIFNVVFQTVESLIYMVK